MRVFYLALVAFLSFSNAFAKNLELRVEKTLCGEIDPYILGDACLVYAADNKEVFALIIELEDYAQLLDNEITDGDLVNLDDRYFSNVDDRNLERLIQDMAKDVDSKIKVYQVSSLKYSLGAIIKSQVLNAFRITCHEILSTQDGMYTNVIIESLITVNSFDTFKVIAPRVRYELTRVNRPNTFFTQFDNQDDEYIKLNKRNFSPTRYLNYFKFSNLYDRKTKGKIHLLLPTEEFYTTSRRKKFYGFLQMADINDVYGTTVKLSCDIMHTTQIN